MRVLVTGATGSLGHALVKRWLKNDEVEKLVVYSRDEAKQGDMRSKFTDERLRFYIGDVRDIARLKLALYDIDVVIHAAALKRVDATAGEPSELVATNIVGTQNVLRAAVDCNVHQVILVSSDKACEAANAYGASKYMAEHLTTSFNTYSAPRGTLCSVVRYGNVLYSRGSVLNVWTRQVANGEPLTLTEPGMTRFLITMEQACWVINYALDSMEGGETFIPILPSTTLENLAESQWPRHERIYMGLRPGGEKKHETLLSTEEAARTIDMHDISVLLPHQHTWRNGSVWGNEPKAEPIERSSWQLDPGDYLDVNQLRELLSDARGAM